MDGLADYIAWMRAADTSAGTIRTYTNYLHRLAEQLTEPLTASVDDLARFLSCVRWSPATRKSARAAVRSFYGWACQTGRLDADPSRLLRPVKVSAGRPRPCPDEVLDRAFAKAANRERLMLMLGAYQGLRRAEIACVHSDDVDGDLLVVHGKGRRERVVPLHPVVARALGELPCGFVFPGQVDGHLSPDRVGHVVGDLLGGRWTAHTLRHRMLTRAYAAERDIRAVQTLAGHQKLDTTMVYTAVPGAALWRAVMAAGPVVAA
jgi:integrase/recombinase XerC